MKKQSVITFRTSEKDNRVLKDISAQSDIKKSELCRLALRLFIKTYMNDRESLFRDYGHLLKQDQIQAFEEKMYLRENNLEYRRGEDFDDIFTD